MKECYICQLSLCAVFALSPMLEYSRRKHTPTLVQKVLSFASQCCWKDVHFPSLMFYYILKVPFDWIFALQVSDR